MKSLAALLSLPLSVMVLSACDAEPSPLCTASAGLCAEAGASRCASDIVQVCAVDARGCLSWSEAEDCSSSGRSCEGGTCADPGCVQGLTRCQGEILQVCDAGAWSVSVDCDATGRRCELVGGAPQCVAGAACAEGATRCSGSVIQSCVSGAWSDGADCAASQGRCELQGGTARCVAEAACAEGATRCSGSVIQTCASGAWRDGADCAINQGRCELQGGAARCVAEAVCDEGATRCGAARVERCVGNTWQVIERCDSPPAATCVDGDKLRSYQGGDCQGAACHYAAIETTCAGGCSAGACVGEPCAGVVCDHPPGECYEATGTCAGGVCSYQERDGGGCDDGDACTVSDVCHSGSCWGEARECVEPPGECYEATGTCAGGVCSYQERDGGGCDDGDPCTVSDVCHSGSCWGEARECLDPPGECYSWLGWCGADGACEYDTATQDGESCDDGDPCTSDDRCGGGACRGTLRCDELSCSGASGCGVCTWSTEQVANAYAMPSQLAAETSLALDPSGRPRIVYGDGGDARQIAWDGSQWQLSTLDDVASEAGLYSSLVIDAAGHSHAVFSHRYDLSAAFTVYDGFAGGAALRKELSSDWSAKDCSVALDGSGAPRVAFFDKGNADTNLELRSWSATGWSSQVIDPEEGWGEDVTLVIDGAGHPHAAYGNTDSDGLRYSRWTGSQWERESWSASATEVTMALGPQDHPKIAYVTEDHHELVFLWEEEGWWDGEVLDSTPTTGLYRPRIAIDGAAHTYIAYVRSGSLMLARRLTGGAWVVEEAFGDDFSNVLSPSLALSASGAPRLSFITTGSVPKLSYSRCD